MSLILQPYDKKIESFAYVLNEKGKRTHQLEIDEEEGGMTEIRLPEGKKFALSPHPFDEEELHRRTLFVAGESGAGKSYYVREFAETYHKDYPQNPIFLISYQPTDVTLDPLKFITRLNAITEEFLGDCPEFTSNDFAHSLVIFDDIDSIVNKDTKETIFGLLHKLLRTGRHAYVSVAYVGHELYGSKELKQILDECMTITFFPKFLNYKRMKYLLEEYFGLSKEQIEKVRTIKGRGSERSATYIKGADKMIMTATRCFII